MRKARWMIVLPFLLLATLACGLMSGIEQIKNAATQLPGMLTAAPTMLGPIETAAAEITPAVDGQLSLQNAKPLLEMSQQFKFTDESVDGQAATVARLTDGGANTFSTVADGFSAAFIGDDPNNLDQIKITVQRNDTQNSVDEGIALINLVLAGVLPANTQVDFASWLTDNYSSLTVSGKSDKTIGKIQFTLERTDANMILTVVPVK